MSTGVNPKLNTSDKMLDEQCNYFKISLLRKNVKGQHLTIKMVLPFYIC